MHKDIDNILVMITEGSMVWFSVMLYKSLSEVAL